MKTLKIEALNDNLQVVMDFVDDYLDADGCPMKTKIKIDLSVEELFVNIANYAYGDKTGEAEISISKENGEYVIVLKDSGIPYNPLEKEDPDITLSAEERQIGGLGIFLVKKNMDSVAYSYENNQNILKITKKPV